MTHQSAVCYRRHSEGVASCRKTAVIDVLAGSPAAPLCSPQAQGLDMLGKLSLTTWRRIEDWMSVGDGHRHRCICITPAL